jgi:hypothetical protein
MNAKVSDFVKLQGFDTGDGGLNVVDSKIRRQLRRKFPL